MKKKALSESTKMYIVEEDRLLGLLSSEHQEICGQGDRFDYFWDMMVESGCDQHVTHREFVEAVENMTFDKLAEMDLTLYEEYQSPAALVEENAKLRARIKELENLIDDGK
jgi:hypothetical protein